MLLTDEERKARRRATNTAAVRKWRAKNRDKARAYTRGPGQRRRHLKWKYGITQDQYEQMLADQGEVCAICGASDAKFVDHCHSTEAVRGILCHHCNSGLGMFKDNTAHLGAAIRYLEKARARTVH